MKISSEQIKKIHTLKSKARLEDEDYRTILESRFNVNTSLGLTQAQASKLIEILYRLAGNIDLASKKQLGKFNIMFKKVYKHKEKKEYIKKQLGHYKNENYLTKKECSKLISGLEEIEKWKGAKENEK